MWRQVPLKGYAKETSASYQLFEFSTSQKRPTRRRQKQWIYKRCIWLSQTGAGLELQLCELTANGATLQLSLAKLPEPRQFSSSQ